MSNLSLKPPASAHKKALRTALPATFFLCSALLISDAAIASISPPITKEEYKVLPAYCRNQRLTSQSLYNPDNEAGWQRALGPAYGHVHHLCWGLVQKMRAYKLGMTTPRGRSELTVAIGNYEYTLNKSPEGSILRPEILTKIGEAYVGLRDYTKAEAAFKQAVTEKPDHMQAYLLWAQFLMKSGKTREALAVAEEGKKHVPNSAALDKLIADIKGSGQKS